MEKQYGLQYILKQCYELRCENGMEKSITDTKEKYYMCKYLKPDVIIYMY